VNRLLAQRKQSGHSGIVAATPSIDVFSYLDYRSYLRDYYVERKENGRGFSYRSFSRRAGLKSPNYLKMVIDGARNLTPPMAERFARACGLADEGTQYFVDLVGFNQASTATERNSYYSRLSASTRYRKTHKLDLAKAAYHSTWYIPAIRELITREDFSEDPEWVAKTLVPSISKSDAKRALATLIELGLAVRSDDGKLTQADALLSTGPETRSLHIANYHRTMMGRAAESIDIFPSEDRDISSLTLCLGENGIRQFKERIQRFRRELLELSALEDDPLQVVQVNFQLFPLSNAERTGESK
jgi:uncharacterized protein (TIGR02147 family)